MPEVFYGEFHAENKRGIKRDVAVCAVTGERIRPGDELRRIPDSNLFVRLKTGVGTKLAEDAWLELVANVKAAEKAKLDAEAKVSKSAPSAAPKEG